MIQSLDTFQTSVPSTPPKEGKKQWKAGKTYSKIDFIGGRCKIQLSRWSLYNYMIVHQPICLALGTEVYEQGLLMCFYIMNSCVLDVRDEELGVRMGRNEL